MVGEGTYGGGGDIWWGRGHMVGEGTYGGVGNIWWGRGHMVGEGTYGRGGDIWWRRFLGEHLIIIITIMYIGGRYLIRNYNHVSRYYLCRYNIIILYGRPSLTLIRANVRTHGQVYNLMNTFVPCVLGEYLIPLAIMHSLASMVEMW